MSLTIENTLGTLLYSRYYSKFHIHASSVSYPYLTQKMRGAVGAGTYLLRRLFFLGRYLLVGCAGQSIHTPRGFGRHNGNSRRENERIDGWNWKMRKVKSICDRTLQSYLL